VLFSCFCLGLPVFGAILGGLSSSTLEEWKKRAPPAKLFCALLVGCV
jgi:hypothetical protein